MGRKKRVRGSEGVCVYCGDTTVLTPDHVPPKSLFLSPRPSNLITVPSCTKCNGGASKDDEYFKNAIVLRDDVANHPDVPQLLKEVMASLRRPEQKKFTRAFVGKMTPVNLITPSGLFVGRAMAMDVSGERIRRVLNRTIRGLYYHERGERLPTECQVISIPDARLPDPRIMDLLVAQPPKIIGKGIFSYRSMVTEDEKFASVWLLVFYGVVTVVAMTMPTHRTT